MKKNIFEGAKFGDKFLTRNDDLAIFIEDNRSVYKLFIKDYDVIFCDEFGKYKGYRDSNLDIVSKYHDEIDEEKLNELANEFADRESIPFSRRSDMDSFKAGYRKAKEE